MLFVQSLFHSICLWRISAGSSTGYRLLQHMGYPCHCCSISTHLYAQLGADWSLHRLVFGIGYTPLVLDCARHMQAWWWWCGEGGAHLMLLCLTGRGSLCCWKAAYTCIVEAFWYIRFIYPNSLQKCVCSCVSPPNQGARLVSRFVYGIKRDRNGCMQTLLSSSRVDVCNLVVT